MRSTRTASVAPRTGRGPRSSRRWSSCMRGGAELRPLAAGLLPWLYGVALNVLRNDARGIRRRDLALARIARPADEPDFADDVAVRLDEERRMRQVLERVSTLPGHERDV